ncbi:MAG: hypothetical protein JWN76_2419 [Chitinophagaceae bacterium]|nr:hypothetical protein [Chitinophagaceae bacterium]
MRITLDRESGLFFMPENLIQNPVLLFDGVCNLCNGFVQFIIKHDGSKQFRFASLQSDYGQKVMKQFNITPGLLNTVYLLENDKLYNRSTAALRVTEKLNGGWKLFYGLIIIPVFIRDAIYNAVARNRYKWFGKKDACWVPTPNLQERFFN